ncbi:dipeptidase [Ammoniphilus sp. CFH 90114]|uniref:dipeptidase n=1 Tax=Ammoniphilus sp. CFH 90114 TaxID=2493665 RepID=UPI00100FAA61|nr:dipeptidase [Ammoniphilus sp. CFH 90114]RXT15190.1 membrane dipeptidase [Ammoniphilus sp. CFH 90114]
MKIIDAHCDALLKLLEEPALSFYAPNEKLQVQYSFMERSNVAVQAFAMFVYPETPVQLRFDTALQMVDIFHEKVVKESKLMPIYKAKDLDTVMKEGSSIRGGLLTLEGADALQGNIVNLRTLYRLGVRALGFTWNYRNEAADGVEEPNPSGLSHFGREVLRECNRLGIVLDVSHLSEKGFWDVVELSSQSFIASHSNCLRVHKHQRNLNDEQIKAIYQKNGVLGLTFVPYFIANKEQISIDDFLLHLEHALALGGEDHIAFGSDFDGITQTMVDLKSMEYYTQLVNSLLVHYKEEQVAKWLHGNWSRVFREVLG